MTFEDIASRNYYLDEEPAHQVRGLNKPYFLPAYKHPLGVQSLRERHYR